MNTTRNGSNRDPLNAPHSKFYSISPFLPQTSPNVSQNFDESSAKISNHEDDHNIMSPHIPDLMFESQQKKKEAHFKHTLSLHQIGNIISGKRNRKPPEPIINNNSNNKSVSQENSLAKRGEVHPAKPVKHPALMRRDTKAPEAPPQKVLTPQNSNYHTKRLTVGQVFDDRTTRSMKRKMSLPNPILQAKAVPVKKIVREETSPESVIMIEDEKEDSEDDKEDLDEDYQVKGGKIVKVFGVGKTRSNRNGMVTRKEEKKAVAAKESKQNLEEEKGENKVLKQTVREVAVKEINVDEYLKYEEKMLALNKSYQRTGTYINCDLRYFNFDFLVDKLGYFDVILMDPPWRIKGAQQNDSSFMFSNSKFNLEYDTLSNQEIMNLKVERLSKKGFLFMWILSNQINTAYEMLNKWGYEVVDQIVWVKLKDSKIYLSHGYYFMHSFEMCLVGYKCPPGEPIEYNMKISNDIMFGEVRTKSRKPDELYEIIEFMMPNSRRIELFARNHNLRPGWFSIGNQLGETYEKWHNEVNCNNCEQRIYIGIKRFKGRHQPDYDLCEKCFYRLGLKQEDFFKMDNLVNEDVLHHYHSCNQCLTEPIWGSRFTCLDCENFDLCECCYDKNLKTEKKFHDFKHNFKVVEIPILANGLPAHRNTKCSHCFQKPIIGVCFKCQQCPNLSFCQNCYFSKPQDEMKKFRGHKSHHDFQILAEPVQVETQLYKCSWCEICPIQGTVYKCENCFSFFFCEKCFERRDHFKPNTANTHKYYHNFVTVEGSQ